MRAAAGAPCRAGWAGWAGAGLGVVVLSAACTAGSTAAPPASTAAPSASTGRAPAAAPTGPARSAAVPTTAAPPGARSGAPPAAGLLAASGTGDGDSWKDTAGREYRLGLVNTPEVGECYGSQATAARKRLVAAGFRAQVYTTDRYGRAVSVVTTADGTDVNVWMARNGFANDRYLTQYREENPALAARLDPAFADAKAERAGLWGACPQPG